MEGLRYFLSAIAEFALDPVTLFHVCWATLLGICVGALPGLTATLGIALLTTLTFRMEADIAILILICMYVGAIYGGSRSAILLNIPGTPASAATTLDGYPLARMGQAGRAMGVATSGSFLGSMIGMLALAFVAPVLANAALSFGSFEFFWLALFGVLISGQLTTDGDALKGWIAGILGLLTAMVGQEGIYSYQRFSYGSTDLSGGIGLLPALVGAFGFAEVLGVMKAKAYEAVRDASDRILPSLRDIWNYKWTIGRSGLIGTVHRPSAGHRRGHGRLDVVRCRQAREQGEGEVRQGLDRGPDGRGDRRQRRRAGRDHSRPDPRRAWLGAGRRAARRDVHPRHPAGAADHDRVPRLRLRGRGDGVHGLRRHPDLRHPADATAPVRADGAARAADARRLRSVHDRELRHHQPGVRHLRHARLRRARLRAPRDELPDGPARARPRARPSAGRAPSAAAWCSRTAAWCPSSRADRGADRVRLHAHDPHDDSSRPSGLQQRSRAASSSARSGKTRKSRRDAHLAVQRGAARAGFPRPVRARQGPRLRRPRARAVHPGRSAAPARGGAARRSCAASPRTTASRSPACTICCWRPTGSRSPAATKACARAPSTSCAA